MRFRVKQRSTAEHSVLSRLAEPETAPKPEKPVSLVEELDNPYGRYYGKPRSREELLKNQ